MEKRKFDFKGFLKKRELARTYARYENIRKLRGKRVLHTSVNLFGTEIKDYKLYAIREGNYTVFRDYVTLKSLGRSSRNLKDAIKALYTEPVVSKENVIPSELSRTQFMGKPSIIKEYTLVKPKRKITLKFTDRIYSYYSPDQRLRTKTVTSRGFRKIKAGMVVVDVEYVKGQKRHRGIYNSAGGFSLNSKEQIQRGILSAIHNGLGSGNINFSPDDIIVHNYWFQYYKDKYNVALKY
jgi:hypothetical protein